MLLTMLGVAPHMLHLCADLMPLMVSTTVPLALVIYTMYLHATIFSSSLSAAVWSSIVFLSQGRKVKETWQRQRPRFLDELLRNRRGWHNQGEFGISLYQTGLPSLRDQL